MSCPSFTVHKLEHVPTCNIYLHNWMRTSMWIFPGKHISTVQRIKEKLGIALSRKEIHVIKFNETQDLSQKVYAKTY